MLNFHVVTARTELGSGGHVLFDKCVIVVVMEGALSVKEHAGPSSPGLQAGHAGRLGSPGLPKRAKLTHAEDIWYSSFSVTPGMQQ